MTIWIIFLVMGLVAAVFLLRPLDYRVASLTGLTSLAIVALAFANYYAIGSPNASSQKAETVPDINAMVQSLADRLAESPDDLEGWKMLGRSYINLGRFNEASDAFREAIRLEDGQNAQTLVDLGESILAASGQTMTPEAISLFENALKVDASNPSALFWGGIASANRGDIDTAADRWELLLSTNPPGDIRQIIEQRVAEWRGLEAPQASGISVDIAVSDGVPDTVPATTPVYIIARDPANPSPPIAVTRRQLSELPATVVLTDRDAMIPGRTLSAFDSVEIVVRLSLSGTPTAASGDWFTESLATQNQRLSLTIDRQVP